MKPMKTVERNCTRGPRQSASGEFTKPKDRTAKMAIGIQMKAVKKPTVSQICKTKNIRPNLSHLESQGLKILPAR